MSKEDKAFTCSSPGCKLDLEGLTSWEIQGSPHSCFILAEFDHHRSAEPAPFLGQFGELGSAPRAQHRAGAAASKCSSRGLGASAKPQERARPNFQDRETSEHRQILTIRAQRVTDAAVAVGALSVPRVTHAAVAPGLAGAAGSLRPLLGQAEHPLCSHLCMVHPPTAATRALPKGSCRTSTAPVESCRWLQRGPSAAQLHNRRAGEGSRTKDVFGLIFGCLNEHRHHHPVASSLTTQCLVHLWVLRIGSDINELNRDLGAWAA